jgi:NifU-like protein involved in Fe-S cluster formation
MEEGPYNAAVRRNFANPSHAGDLERHYPRGSVAEGYAANGGCRVLLAAAAEGGVLREVRFRVFGCPHLIAAAEAFCEDVEGRPAGALREFSVPALMERFEVPVEKTGRILLLEDAAGALARELWGQ